MNIHSGETFSPRQLEDFRMKKAWVTQATDSRLGKCWTTSAFVQERKPTRRTLIFIDFSCLGDSGLAWAKKHDTLKFQVLGNQFLIAPKMFSISSTLLPSYTNLLIYKICTRKGWINLQIINKTFQYILTTK